MVHLELCNPHHPHLSNPSSRLVEAHEDLQQTRTKLSQEEFISSELTARQERLHSTAGQVGPPPALLLLRAVAETRPDL